MKDLSEWNLCFDSEASTMRMNSQNADKVAEIKRLEAELANLQKKQAEELAERMEFELYQKADQKYQT